MTNDARNPAHPAPVPDDDPEAQRLLAEVGRFSPRQGFEDRVVKQVRVPIPRWLRGIRDRIQAVTSGVPGWIMLATFSLATAATWGTGVVMALRYRGPIEAGAESVLQEANTGLRQDVAGTVLPALETARAEVAAWLASFGMDLGSVVIGYGMLVLICVVALRWLTAEPARTRGVVDAAR